MDELVTKADVEAVVGRVATLTATNDQLQKELDWLNAVTAVMAGSLIALGLLIVLVSADLRRLAR